MWRTFCSGILFLLYLRMIHLSDNLFEPFKNNLIMENRNSGLWIGLGVGSVIGALAYHFSRTSKAKELKRKVCKAYRKITDEAKEALDETKEALDETKEKVAETGKNVADDLRNKAHTMADTLASTAGLGK